MKKFIQGQRYDIDVDIYIGAVERNGWHEYLYMSHGAGYYTYSHKYGFGPMSPESAREWAENELDDDALLAHWPED